VRGLARSPLRGPAGNVEFLTLLQPGQPSIDAREAIDRVLVERDAS
jgi:hypothetical protein